MRIRQHTILSLFLAASVFWTGEGQTAAADEDNRIRPYPPNPYYWQYKGKLVLLLGGSDDDNLFQWTGSQLTDQLDLLKSVGGNYVRNTMSARLDKGFEVQPFEKLSNGKYDLRQWNDEYWRRFEAFLAETHRREIIVQIEVWATWDFYGEWWDVHPFNPRNNVNYTARESGLPERLAGELAKPWRHPSDFFRSVPGEKNLKIVLDMQQRLVAKMLSVSLKHDHVLYCMDNETATPPAWAAHWADFIRQEAQKAGKQVETTEMWDKWDLAHPQHNATFNHPERYAFLEISQNNHQKGQPHYDNALARRKSIRQAPRPLTNVKIYGADGERFGNTRDGIERFWRNVFGGHAAARFHRPPGGLGLSQTAQRMIQSARDATGAFDLFTCEPHNELLGEREADEAYCLANPGREYAVYFPREGEVTLNTGDAREALTARWYEVDRGRWQPPEKTPGEKAVRLRTPGKGPWAAVVKTAP